MITHEQSLENFSEQIAYALKNYVNHEVDIKSIDTIVLGGLGGSGIGARFVKNFYFELASKPIEVVSDYHLPAYCNNKTLVVLASYSGDTEETLSLYEEAMDLECKIITISSGGQLSKLGVENNQINYLLPNGYQPRMALGFSLTFNLLILGELFAVENVQSELEIAIEEFNNCAEWKEAAVQLMQYFEPSFKDKFVIITERLSEAVGVRFTQQLQENAKLEGYVNILPENNHNALESYYDKNPSNVLLLNCKSNDRVDLRFEFVKTILDKNKIPYATLTFDGKVLSEIFKVVHILDWLSIFLSQKNKANNMSVDNISNLKNYLLAH